MVGVGCRRAKEESSTKGNMFLVNHFLSFDLALADVVQRGR